MHPRNVKLPTKWKTYRVKSGRSHSKMSTPPAKKSCRGATRQVRIPVGSSSTSRFARSKVRHILIFYLRLHRCSLRYYTTGGILFWMEYGVCRHPFKCGLSTKLTSCNSSKDFWWRPQDNLWPTVCLPGSDQWVRCNLKSCPNQWGPLLKEQTNENEGGLYLYFILCSERLNRLRYGHRKLKGLVWPN